MLRVFTFVLLMGAAALAQSARYGVGRTPTPEEIRAWDISIGPTGEELPPGHGTVKEGALVYRTKCAGCHGATGIEGTAPILKSKAGKDVDLWERGRILPLRAPFATTVWDYINRGMPLGNEGPHGLRVLPTSPSCSAGFSRQSRGPPSKITPGGEERRDQREGGGRPTAAWRSPAGR